MAASRKCRLIVDDEGFRVVTPGGEVLPGIRDVDLTADSAHLTGGFAEISLTLLVAVRKPEAE